MSRTAFYKAAVQNLGIISLLRLQSQKRLSQAPKMRLTSKMLHHPVLARRGTSDTDIFTQILVDHEYESLTGISVSGLVIDLGANVGYSSAYFLSRYPAAFVIAVEPDHSNYVMTCENLAPYAGRFKTVKAAAWPHKEKLKFETASTASGNEWGRRVQSSEGNDGLIDTVSIPELIAMSGRDRVSLLKIDIEGAEAELFNVGADQWLDKIDTLVIELHGEKASRAFYSAIAGSNFRATKTAHNAIVCVRS